MLTTKFKATVLTGIGVIALGVLGANQLTQQKQITNLENELMVRPEKVTVVVTPTPTPTATPTATLKVTPGVYRTVAPVTATPTAKVK